MNLEEYLKSKLEEIEKKIESGTIEDRDGMALLFIRECLEKHTFKSIQEKYYEIIEKLSKNLPAEVVESNEFTKIGEDILVRKSKDRLEVYL